MINTLLGFMNRTTSDNNNANNFDPDEVLDVTFEQVFHRLDKLSLVKCMLACHRFHDLISSDSFWVEHSRYHGIRDVLPPISWRRAACQKKFEGNEDGIVDVSDFSFDYKRMVLTKRGYSPLVPEFMSFFRAARNRTIRGVLRSDDFCLRAGGDGIKLETSGSVGCEAHPDVSECFAFSYANTSMYIFVDLVASGIDPWVLDHVRPKIRISQKINHRHDCSGNLMFAAQLNYNETQWIEENGRQQSTRNTDNHRFKSFKKEWNQWSESSWEDVSFEFDSYPSGMRHLTVLNQGQDGLFWAGFYGPKFANIQIQVILPDDVIIKPLKEDTERRQEDNEPMEVDRQPQRNHRRAWGVPPAIFHNANN